MCGIGGILRILKPGDADYPSGDAALCAPSGAWLWHGMDVRDLAYAQVDSGATAWPAGQAVPSQASIPKAQVPPAWIIPESWLDAIDENIAWRGPDGAGRFRDRVIRPDGTIVEVALVHRRLSIIDIEGGAQPMVVRRCPRCAEKARGTGHQPLVPNAKCQVTSLSAIVFNGCIYNHRELRAELEAKGHVFESDHSDTEVLLHGWGEWGREAFLKLDGMFAIICWDGLQGRVIFARDRFGEKPLYCATSLVPLAIACASEPRCVGAVIGAVRSVGDAYTMPRSNPKPDPQALTDWVSLGYGVGSTPIDGVWEFPFNQALLADVKARDSREVWRDVFGAVAVAAAASVDVAFHGLATIVIHNLRAHKPKGIRGIDAIERLIAESVRSRLDADVPIGCFVSGGIDSSLIALFASREVEALTTLCVRMPDERYDESDAAQLVADALGTNHIVIDAGENAAEDLEKVIETLGLPFGDSSILPTYWVCRAASKCVKVALSGDGGDELFYGYDRYRAARWLAGFGWLIGTIPLSVLRRSDPRSRSEKTARMVNAALQNKWYHELMALFQVPDRKRLLGKKAKGHLLRESFVPPHFEPRETDLTHYLPGDLLRKVDTASMMCNLEVRCPMLSRAIADAALATPRRRLTRGGPKGILRELARRYLPREIVDRPKQGFAIPISDWWRNDFGGLQTLLLDMLAGDRPFGRVHDVLEINMEFVRQMLDEHWAAGGLTPMHTTRHVRPRDHGQRLFALVSLAIWARSIHHGDTEAQRKT